MQNELVNQQQRVAELEAALAGVAAARRRSRYSPRVKQAGIFSAGIVAAGLATY